MCDCNTDALKLDSRCRYAAAYREVIAEARERLRRLERIARGRDAGR